MRKILLLVLCFCFLFITCSKEEPQKEAVQELPVQEVDEEPIVEQPIFTTGVIYVNNIALYVENEEGKMKWAASGTVGDKATYLGESKEATRTDGQKRNFFHVDYKGKEYWIQDYCYEPHTIPGFISTDNAILYKTDSLTAATSEVLPKYLVVAVYTDSLIDSSKFVKIAAYCTDLTSSWTVKDKYVKREAVEILDRNVEAMVLAQVAAETQNEIVRKELFANAIEMGTSYSFEIQEISELTEAKILEDEFLKTLPVDTIQEKIKLEKDTDLYSIPNEAGVNADHKKPKTTPRFLTTLEAGTTVNATKSFVIDAIESFLTMAYYVESGKDKGWIELSRRMSSDPEMGDEE